MNEWQTVLPQKYVRDLRSETSKVCDVHKKIKMTYSIILYINICIQIYFVYIK